MDGDFPQAYGDGTLRELISVFISDLGLHFLEANMASTIIIIITVIAITITIDVFIN